MQMFTAENWPLVAVSLCMILAAIIDGWMFKVPNRLTFPVIISGWLLGIVYDLGLLVPSEHFHPTWCSHTTASFSVMMLGFVTLYPIRLLNMMGAGDVKMQMGFASWIGAFYGLYFGSSVFLCGWALGILAGGVIGLIMIVAGGRLPMHLENAREIVHDFLTLGPAKIAEKAAQRKPRMVRLPYGIPLCIGYVAYLLYLNW